MPIHRDQSKKGKHIKIGAEWIQVSDLQRAEVAHGGGKHVILHHKKAGKKTIYRGAFVDHVKQQLTKEGVGD